MDEIDKTMRMADPSIDFRKKQIQGGPGGETIANVKKVGSIGTEDQNSFLKD
jgi:hypothetical protein